ncbi:beta-N-acetylhexosaminidase [Echinimonas agarilytica]|uniref:Beta-hexosaminidase n=1 Tax=Echinimonas agarilytica TaxID=1215918 RepID=A0AA41W6M9_9GAMM|nr:beta-N-acetylhexosaminidase [Echinimonas agarilytica]MCM2679865.1 beta-N-acetylhexosaminidase [Echinimonas agarilytica]
MGPLMLDLNSTQLQADEHKLLQHPAVGGVIFFTRNFESRSQLISLISEVRAAANKPLILAVDHEGGRVQRFRSGFSAIPAMADIPVLAADCGWNEKRLARELGWLMAAEVLACDIDISFAPVLDLNGISEVIGNRSFGTTSERVIDLADAFIEGMHDAGMKCTGKHYPGHGSVAADSHIAIPVDERSKACVENDEQVFRELIDANQIDAIMPAHVIYPEFDDKPAGFSKFWLDRLRQDLSFEGVIFSDDLAMKGAEPMGSYPQRAQAALNAGCDMVLLCNDREGVNELLANTAWRNGFEDSQRIKTLLNSTTTEWDYLHSCERYTQLLSAIPSIAIKE